jgi:four helix bundle protein
MQDFRKLKMWEKAHQLTLAVYRVTVKFPKDETYGLISQIRRAAASIPTNMAEGCGRDTEPEFNRFMQIAMGSACETEYQLLLAKDLGYLGNDEYLILNEQINEIKRMLSTLIVKIKNHDSNQTYRIAENSILNVDDLNQLTSGS